MAGLFAALNGCEVGSKITIYHGSMREPDLLVLQKSGDLIIIRKVSWSIFLVGFPIIEKHPTIETQSNIQRAPWHSSDVQIAHCLIQMKQKVQPFCKSSLSVGEVPG